MTDTIDLSNFDKRLDQRWVSPFPITAVPTRSISKKKDQYRTLPITLQCPNNHLYQRQMSIPLPKTPRLGCPECEGSKVCPGINDLESQRPDLIRRLEKTYADFLVKDSAENPGSYDPTYHKGEFLGREVWIEASSTRGGGPEFGDEKSYIYDEAILGKTRPSSPMESTHTADVQAIDALVKKDEAFKAHVEENFKLNYAEWDPDNIEGIYGRNDVGASEALGDTYKEYARDDEQRALASANQLGEARAIERQKAAVYKRLALRARMSSPVKAKDGSYIFSTSLNGHGFYVKMKS